MLTGLNRIAGSANSYLLEEHSASWLCAVCLQLLAQTPQARVHPAQVQVITPNLIGTLHCCAACSSSSAST